MNENELENRITAIEMKLSYMEDFMNQLQAVAVEQSKQVEVLKQENKMLAAHLKDVSNMLEGDILNNKPPHY